MTQIPIWRLSEQECLEAATLLTRAFDADPLYSRTMPDPTERSRVLPEFFAICLRYGCRFGATLAAGRQSGRMEAVAVQLPYPEARWSAERLKAVDGAAIGELLPAAFGKVMEEVRRDLHPAFARFEVAGSCDVPLLGVHPDAHGQGLGSTLLARVTADAAEDGRPVTLWTVNSGNVGFYERNGFEVLGSGTFCDGELPWWALAWRSDAGRQSPDV